MNGGFTYRRCGVLGGGHFAIVAMEKSLRQLESAQKRILDRISAVEIALLDRVTTTHTNTNTNTNTETGTVSRLSNILKSGGVQDFIFKRVASDYYDLSLQSRRDILDAPSIHHLCKSIVLVNTQAPASVVDCRDRNNSKYYVVVIQYTARLNAENVKNFLYSLNNGKIGKKKFNMRLAPEEESLKLTGFEHNAVTCIGMKTDIPVILDEAITRLEPDFFWLGGGEIELKLGIRTSQFIDCVKPFIFNCSS